MQHRFSRVVRETDIFKRNTSGNAIELLRPIRTFVFQIFVQNFARPLQPGQRFSNLRADPNDLKHRRNEQVPGKLCIPEKRPASWSRLEYAARLET